MFGFSVASRSVVLPEMVVGEEVFLGEKADDVRLVVHGFWKKAPGSDVVLFAVGSRVRSAERDPGLDGVFFALFDDGVVGTEGVCLDGVLETELFLCFCHDEHIYSVCASHV